VGGFCTDKCSSDSQCAAGGSGTKCCTTCINTTSDPKNCGGCGKTCPEGAACAVGECVCPAGQTECKGACVNFDTDPSNCGGCGQACSSDAECVGGKCIGPAQCVNNQDCKNIFAGPFCLSGSCGCKANSDCIADYAAVCIDGKCGCGTNADCKTEAWPKCPAGGGICGCSSDADCSGLTPRCDSGKQCVCFDDSDCKDPAFPECSGTSCAKKSLGKCVDDDDCKGSISGTTCMFFKIEGGGGFAKDCGCNNVADCPPEAPVCTEAKKCGP
jgi:hypothetical protein